MTPMVKEPEYADKTATGTAPAAPGAPPVGTPVSFTIVCTLETDQDGYKNCVPRNIPKYMRPGDTASYVSPDGDVQIDFDPDSGHTSPYADAAGNDLPTVKGGVVLNVRNKGQYMARCSITGKVSAIWNPKTAALSGGNHVVI